MDDAEGTEVLSNDSKADAIADLLVGSEQQAEEIDEEESEVETEDQPDEESDEEETPTEDSSEEEVDDSDFDNTWESTLGLEDDQLSFDDDGNIKGVNVKVNGEASTVSFGDLIKGYQNNKSFTQKSQAFAEERKKFETYAESVATDFKNKLENVEAMSKFLGDQLVSEFEGIDWDKLRVENPAEYAAARQDYASRASQMQEAYQAIQAEKENFSKAEKEKMMQNHHEFVSNQRQIMLSNNPEWNDPDKFNRDMDSLKSFLTKQYNFTEQDFNTVADARIIEVLKDAKKFREGKEVVKAKTRKPVPKFQKSVGSKPKKVSKLETLTKKAKSAKGQRKRDLQTSAISELLLGGKQ